MSKIDRNSESVKAYLRSLGNPYASLQIVDDTEEAQMPSAVHAEQRLNASLQTDIGIEAAQPAMAAYAEQRPSGRHPYALISDEDEAHEIAAHPVVKQADNQSVGTLSKAEFEKECRRILRPYVPALERGRLRQVYRDFIARNVSRSPAARYRLINLLQKYDLSKVSGINAQFNRETEALTDEKLRQIERLVENEDQHG